MNSRGGVPDAQRQAPWWDIERSRHYGAGGPPGVAMPLPLQRMRLADTSGVPIPGGGCFSTMPNGQSVTRFDRNCDGTPTGFGGEGGEALDPHGQKIRGLMGG